MSEVVAIVEGQTEQTFVRDHLAAHLGALGISIWAILPGRSIRRGGVRRWVSAIGDIQRMLRTGRYVTTMFDYYAMPLDWPGREEAKNVPWNERGNFVENAIARAVADACADNFDSRQLIPYVQVHEFEALLFADVETTAEVLTPIARRLPLPLCERLQSVVAAAGHPEAIDDGYETCPSRQLAKIAPAYRKAIYGPIAAGRIGLAALRSGCPHFGQWVSRLEALGTHRNDVTSSR